MNLQLTKREKIMLGALGSLLLVGGYYQFILNPQLNGLKELQGAVKDYEQQVQQVKNEINPNSKVYKDFKILNQKIEGKTRRFFPEIIQERIITLIDEKIKQAQLETPTLVFTELEIAAVEIKREEPKNLNYQIKSMANAYKGIKENQVQEPAQQSISSQENSGAQEESQNNEKDQGIDSIEKMVVTTGFKGSYSALMNFIKAIESMDYKIIISGLNIARAESGELAGTMILDFYGLPKLHEQDAEYLTWNFSSPKGTNNPFASFAGYTVPVKTENRVQNTAVEEKQEVQLVEEYDFLLIAKPIASDMPTVLMGRGNDSTASSYIYADNAGTENVELQVFEENGKYYYRYKTQYESYPKNYEDRIAFIPKGKKIQLQVFSTPRKDASDKNAVGLSIVNETKLQLEVSVKNEDKRNPRIKFVSKLGNISISQ